VSASEQRALGIVRAVRKTSVEERRVEILETTCLVVIERGFAATRVADVANRLGVSSGLIHYHFESKDHLLAEAFEFAAATDLARLETELAKEGTAVERLDRIFKLYTPTDEDPGWLLWIDGWGEAIRSPTLKKISQDLDLRWQERLEDVIIEGVKEGEFTCGDPHASAWRLAALIDGLGVQVAVHEDVLSKAELLAWVRTAACTELGLAEGAFDKKPSRSRRNGGNSRSRSRVA
jgi:AcrR family transcriptional regulator